MDAIYSPKTFKYDHVVRDEKGVPVGRIVLRSDDSYVEGADIQVSILRVPMELRDSVLGTYIYIDGFRYRVPKKFPEFRFNKRGNEWVASSFILERA